MFNRDRHGYEYDMHLQIIRCGTARLTTDWPTRAERPFWRAYWNPDPGAVVIHAGRRHRLNPSRVVLIPPRTPVEQHLESGPLRTFFIHFTAGLPWDLCHGRLWSCAAHRLGQGWLMRLANRLPLGTTLQPHDAVRVQVMALQLLEGLPPAALAPAVDPAISRLITAIHSNPGHPWTCASLAATAGLSVRSAQRHCRAAGLPSPHTLLLDARLDHAADLLVASDATIDSIAERCGFSDRHHFTRRFRTRFACGPAAFRRQPW